MWKPGNSGLIGQLTLVRYKFFDKTQLEHTNRSLAFVPKWKPSRQLYQFCCASCSARMFAKFPDCLKVAFIDCAALLEKSLPSDCSKMVPHTGDHDTSYSRSEPLH